MSQKSELTEMESNTILAQSNVSRDDSIFQKLRKDPKKMTMDELDEFLKKNQVSEPSYLNKKTGNKDSFNYSNNYSQFNESSKINSNTNANSNNSNIKDLKRDNKKSTDSKSEQQVSPLRNSSHKFFYFDESQNFNQKASGANFSLNADFKPFAGGESLDKKENAVVAHFPAKNNFFSEDNFVVVNSPQNVEHIVFNKSPDRHPTFHDLDQFNIVKSPEAQQPFSEVDKFKTTLKSFASPTRDNMFNFSGFSEHHDQHGDERPSNPSRLNMTNENIIASPQGHSSSQFQSQAAKNVIKALQDKNNLLLIENEDLKRTILEQNKFYSKSSEVEKKLKEEINSLSNENKNLVQRLNKSQVELNMLSQNLSMLEKEKIRHLDFSAEEKEELNKKLYELKMENYKLLSENKKGNEVTNGFKDEIEKLLKEVSLLKKENVSLKKQIQIKLASYNKELEDIKAKFDLERSDFLDKIAKLNDYVQRLQTQKKEIILDCEAKISKIRAELMNIQDSKVKSFLRSLNPPIEIKPGSRFIKLKTQEKPLATSRSKDKKTVSSNANTSRRNQPQNNLELAAKKGNNSYFKKLVTTTQQSGKLSSYNDVTSLTYNNVKKSLKESKISRDVSGIDIKDTNNDLLKEMTISAAMESQNIPTERPENSITKSQETVSKRNLQRKSNSCLDLLQSNPQIDQTAFGSANYNSSIRQNSRGNEQPDQMKLNEVNDLIFNLERTIAELSRNYQSLSTSLKNATSQGEYSQINKKMTMLSTSLQIQNDKLSDLKNCQREILLKGAINF